MSVPPGVADTLLADAVSLRRLAHSLLAADDADDVVQDAGVTALSRPAALRHPGSWLRGTVRKLALLARRGSARRRARERLAARDEAHPHGPEALAMQAELVRNVGAAVHALEEPFRTAVLLRFWHDLPVAAIAARLSVPHNTVRSRLQRGLARLREQLDREHGGRERWAAPLAWLLPLRTPAAFAILLMNKKLLLGAAAALLVAFAIPWLLHAPAPADPPSAPGTPPVAAAAPVPADAGDGSASRRETVATPQAVAVAMGTLVVQVVHSAEPKAGAGLTVCVGQPDGDFRVDVLRTVTDAAGTARFASLPPGRFSVWCNLSGGRKNVEVGAGATSECTLQLRGVTVTGTVVDAAGVGVGGALVEHGLSASSGLDGQPAAITAADGTFVVRNAAINTLLGARAQGYAASQLYSLARGQDVAETLRIELVAEGGWVAGSVATADGVPVRDAVVRVGEGKLDSLRSTPQGAPPLPAQVCTDADGRFLAVGVPVGACPVQVRAPGLAPWSASCEVAAGRVANVDVRLLPGVTCAGVVRVETGEPTADVVVRCGRDGEFLQYFARSGADGAFVLHGLPAGEIELWAVARPLGKASARVRGDHGASVRCELVFTKGLALRGQVTDEHDKPIPWVAVQCEAEGAGPNWRQHAITDESGRFLATDCPAGRLLLVKVSVSGRVPLQRQGVDPRAGPVVLQLQPDTSPRARITGRVVGPEGQRATGVEVQALGQQQQHQTLDLASADGTFAIEVTAGTWEVRVQSQAHPTVFAGKRELPGGGAWDLGTVELTHGGTLVVRDGGKKGLDYLVLDGNEQFRCGLYSPTPPQRSELLAPGEHLLVVRGDGIAAHVVPFTIRSGQETELELRLVAGVRQRFEFVPAAGGELPPWIRFAIRRDGRLVGYCSERGDRGEARTAEVWLEPGQYVLTANMAKVQGTAMVTVGREEGPPVRITVR